ncbi:MULTISPECIES: 5-formyltetrahydrofolate cyclo-ligase [Virgibacillus]|uniref:5-formyltetrahydrofolate cyclo-ligase n=1 Tax=Virgibacillus pantothenticus TaxID=1473 RepID=A0A0L0QPJ4_VIRPA|nr:MULTISPECIES: 5-formyltetrahydrofolate cyclo-ligase [Virgibacillus]API90542.1 5-formyltetrahydrofolate cyclo-ligase [Virgibacillus sp. 6R]KNE20499.1 5-formyltetrahydrofolate cyclo-ligase [Virgibacillus pantothenticus]MBS7429653.1 5-formyltetrahydrofolate cyclo-ligase [Virgibacillus sp. 19R1-5]MED3737978.1 5-formyltetrahydrofolate cyclo-ligase [Virgibacillus pantothenticus]QTY17746.1 5-formyltetrahydrofolate cyclo-ligase [Virgibacillus pantothenticus]
MTKEQLRKSTITILNQMDAAQRKKVEQQLHHQLVTSSIWKNADTIGITISKGFEWDTNKLIKQAWEQGKTVCAPKCVPATKTMDFYAFHTYDQLEVVYYRLLEPDPSKTVYIPPANIDLLVVPGIVFDQKGYRIGFGGGYYDRFLVGFPNFTVSILHSSQLIESIPKNVFDIPVQHLITEAGLLLKKK